MPSGDILELIGVVYVIDLTKNLLSISVMTDLGDMADLMISKSPYGRDAKILVKCWPEVFERVVCTSCIKD